MKILCVLLPHFPLRCELARHPDAGRNTVVTCAAGSQRRLLDHSPELDGLRPDMPLEQALGIYADIRLLDGDLPYYRSSFDNILDRLQQISPLVEDAGPGCAYVDMEGMGLVYPGGQALAQAVREAVPPPFEVRLGMAGGKFQAYLAATQGPPGGCAHIGRQAGARVKNTPCHLLPVSGKVKLGLAEFGLRTLGQVAALPCSALESQFGPEGKRIWQLANGHDPAPLRQRAPRQVLEQELDLPCVTVRLDVILLAIESMLARTFLLLGSPDRGISLLDIWTRTLASGYWQKNVHFRRPALSVEEALSRIKQVMEFCPQPGPVDQVGIKVTGLANRPGRQKSFFSEVKSRQNLLSDIHQLELKLGSPQLFKFKEIEPWSRIPERRHMLTPLSR